MKQIIKNRQTRRAKLNTSEVLSEVVAEANEMTGSPTTAAAATNSNNPTVTKESPPPKAAESKSNVDDAATAVPAEASSTSTKTAVSKPDPQPDPQPEAKGMLVAGGSSLQPGYRPRPSRLPGYYVVFIFDFLFFLT